MSLVSFYAEVDPNNAISELNESNNRFPASGTFALNFRNRTTMKIVGQRLRYHPSGYSGTQYAGGSAVNGVAGSWLSQVLPIRNNGINYSVASGYKDWTTNLGGGDGQHALIQSLNTQWIMQNAFSWLFGTGSFTGARHVYGWAPSAGYSGGHADMPVYPHAGGLGVVGIGSDAAGTDTDNPGSGALIFGHELMHDLQRLAHQHRRQLRLIRWQRRFPIRQLEHPGVRLQPDHRQDLRPSQHPRSDELLPLGRLEAGLDLAVHLEQNVQQAERQRARHRRCAHRHVQQHAGDRRDDRQRNAGDRPLRRSAQGR